MPSTYEQDDDGGKKVSVNHNYFPFVQPFSNYHGCVGNRAYWQHARNQEKEVRRAMTTNYQANDEVVTIAAPTSHNPWLQTPTEMLSATVATDILVFEMHRAGTYVSLSVTADRLRVIVTFGEWIEPLDDLRCRYSRSNFTAREFVEAITGKGACYEVYGWPSATHPDPDDNQFSAEQTLAFGGDDGQTKKFTWYADLGEPDFHLRLPVSYLRAAMGQDD